MVEDYVSSKEEKFKSAVERKVPSTSFSRAFEFSKVGASMLTNILG